MSERLLEQWNLDRATEVRVYQKNGWKAIIERIFGRKRTFDVPLGKAPEVYETVPIKLRSGQRAEVLQENIVVAKD